MTENQQQDQGQQRQQPGRHAGAPVAQPQDAEQSVRQAGTPPRQRAGGQDQSGDQSGTFGDGSTQEQQDQLVQEAEEANRQTKEFADAEREARQQND